MKSSDPHTAYTEGTRQAGAEGGAGMGPWPGLGYSQLHGGTTLGLYQDWLGYMHRHRTQAWVWRAGKLRHWSVDRHVERGFPLELDLWGDDHRFPWTGDLDGPAIDYRSIDFKHLARVFAPLANLAEVTGLAFYRRWLRQLLEIVRLHFNEGWLQKQSEEAAAFGLNRGWYMGREVGQLFQLYAWVLHLSKGSPSEQDLSHLGGDLSRWASFIANHTSHGILQRMDPHRPATGYKVVTEQVLSGDVNEEALAGKPLARGQATGLYIVGLCGLAKTVGIGTEWGRTFATAARDAWDYWSRTKPTPFANVFEVGSDEQLVLGSDTGSAEQLDARRALEAL